MLMIQKVLKVSLAKALLTDFGENEANIIISKDIWPQIWEKHSASTNCLFFVDFCLKNLIHFFL